MTHPIQNQESQRTDQFEDPPQGERYTSAIAGVQPPDSPSSRRVVWAGTIEEWWLALKKIKQLQGRLGSLVKSLAVSGGLIHPRPLSNLDGVLRSLRP